MNQTLKVLILLFGLPQQGQQHTTKAAQRFENTSNGEKKKSPGVIIKTTIFQHSYYRSKIYLPVIT